MGYMTEVNLKMQETYCKNPVPTMWPSHNKRKMRTEN